MARHIDADKLIEELSAGCMPIYERGISGVLGDEKCIKDYIDNAPTVDVRPERHGHWIANTDNFTPALRCSACGYNKPEIAGEYLRREPENYCPNCGAKMDGEELDSLSDK